MAGFFLGNTRSAAGKEDFSYARKWLTGGHPIRWRQKLRVNDAIRNSGMHEVWPDLFFASFGSMISTFTNVDYQRSDFWKRTLIINVQIWKINVQIFGEVWFFWTFFKHSFYWITCMQVTQQFGWRGPINAKFIWEKLRIMILRDLILNMDVFGASDKRKWCSGCLF